MENSIDSRKIAIYSRKSKFTEKGESIENQIELCRNQIKTSFPETTENDIVIFEDEGFSGGNTKRPQYQAMMRDVRNKDIRAIVFYRLDRVSRSVSDFAAFVDELEALQVKFIAVRENLRTDNPGSKAYMYMISVFAQFEREVIAERIKDNMQELAKTGRWLGGTTPTGYQSIQLVERVTLDGKTKKAFKLDIIKEEADLIKRIFKKFIEFNSLTKVDTYLFQNNVKTKNGKDFSRFAIKGILRNPVYMIADEDAWNYFEKAGVDIFAEKSEFEGKHGIIAYNKTHQTSGKSNKMRDMEEWIISVGRHKGLISGSDWIKTRSMLEQNRSKDYRKPRSHVALLPGLLICGDCGDTMRPKLSQRNNAQGERIYSYLCETKEKSRRMHCDIKNPNGNLLDTAVCEEIKKLSEDSSEFLTKLEGAEKSVKSNTQEYEQQEYELQKQLIENERQIKTLVISLTKSEGTPAYDYITTQINELHEKNINIKQRKEEISNMQLSEALSDNQFDLMRDLLITFAGTFELMSVDEKRAALRVFIKRVVWDGENVHIYFFGSDDDNDNGSKNRNRNNQENTHNNTETKEPLRGDSKRGAHGIKGQQKEQMRGVAQRSYRYRQRGQ